MAHYNAISEKVKLSLIDQILCLHQEKTSLRTISEIVGISRPVIKTWLKEKGVEFTRPKPRVIPEEVALQVVELTKEGLSIVDIAKRLKVSNSYVEKMQRKHKVWVRVKTEITTQIRFQIYDLYEQGLSAAKVAKQLDIGKPTVLKYLPEDMKREQADYNTYTCDYHYFDNIDTQDKAYFLGLFYADGYNCQQKTYIKLGFAEGDSPLLYKFKEAIGATHTIGIRTRENENHQDFYTMTICSPILCDALAKWGCVQNKTHILEHIPDIDPNLIRHFIRGYYDGDGSVWYTGGRPNISFTGNKPFLLEVQQVLIHHLGLTETSIYIRHKDRDNEIGDLRYSNGSVKKILEFLYSDCNYFSERKRDNFKELIESDDMNFDTEDSTIPEEVFLE